MTLKEKSCQRVFNGNNTGVTSGAGTSYLSGALWFNTVFFSSVHVAQSLVLYVVFFRSLFVLFLLAIVLSVFLFTASNYPFGVFKLFVRGLV